jgi:serine protease
MADAGGRFGVSMRTVRQMTSGAHVVAVDRELSRADLAQLVASLSANPDVEYAEEDRLLQATFTPNDTHYNLQWHYYEATGGLNLPSAWDTSTGSGVTVAVIDTGYRPHVDLASNIVGGYDFISDTFVSRDGTVTATRRIRGLTLANDCQAGWTPTELELARHARGRHCRRLTNNASGVAGVAFNARAAGARARQLRRIHVRHCGRPRMGVWRQCVWRAGQP